MAEKNADDSQEQVFPMRPKGKDHLRVPALMDRSGDDIFGLTSKGR